jgi:hypothetical protein
MQDLAAGTVGSAPCASGVVDQLETINPLPSTGSPVCSSGFQPAPSGMTSTDCLNSVNGGQIRFLLYVDDTSGVTEAADAEPEPAASSCPSPAAVTQSLLQRWQSGALSDDLSLCEARTIGNTLTSPANSGLAQSAAYAGCTNDMSTTAAEYTCNLTSGSTQISLDVEQPVGAGQGWYIESVDVAPDESTTTTGP